MVKSVIIGNSGVGKTCLMARYIYGYFNDKTNATCGTEFFQKTVKTPNRIMNIQFWDTAGQELFRSVTRGYYRGAHVAYIVFDITYRDSFKAVSMWLKDVRDVSEDAITVLIGNKSDLSANRTVTTEEAQKFVTENKMMAYFEVSAMTGRNVEKAINDCIPAIDRNFDMRVFTSNAKNPTFGDVCNSRKTKDPICC